VAERDRALALLAGRQHGVVSIRQLEQQIEFSHQAVERAVGSGRLHRVRRGVYTVGHTNLSLHGECLAAVLAVGPGALLSYHSAGWLWGIWRGSPKPIHVTAFVPRHHPAPRGVVRHRARNLVDADRAFVEGIPVTSVARTLLDLAWKLSGDQLRRALERAEDLGLFDLDELRAVVERNRGHHGAKRLPLTLATYEPRRFTRSGFERRFVDHLVRAGLPRPTTGWNEVGYELDVYWPDLAFGIELDTYETTAPATPSSATTIAIWPSPSPASKRSASANASSSATRTRSRPTSRRSFTAGCGRPSQRYRWLGTTAPAKPQRALV
jgi:predicted transcriptional regulator of viral defense system